MDAAERARASSEPGIGVPAADNPDNPDSADSTDSSDSIDSTDRGGPGVGCWCCGRGFAEERLVRLGARPEAAVCLQCSRFLHRRAKSKADALATGRTLAARTRAGAANGRAFVIGHGWHRGHVLGPVARLVDRFLP